ncbi:Sec-independent protein translocase protein TatB [Rhizomicrobium electricum]|uniref:Sec-independent protein translocase protein TatB n=1 Tax=Rhizomicrobium electricum TaxID=480070 RepID=A0ABP3PF44_9PROT|nr:Sec-independent protein translocase protein TatB [Rhizomicrobium electricum]NIJ48183.1 sec-independent protein translocase protein TatB [Rhizomicrobium electricum]
MDFGLSWSHMLLVLVVALVVVGPKDLPKLMRKMGQWTAKARGMADQFRRSFDDMARQSELDELRKELDELRNARPLAGVEQQLNDVMTGPAVSLDPDPIPEPAIPVDAAAEPAATTQAEAAEHAVEAGEPAPAPQPQTDHPAP